MHAQWHRTQDMQFAPRVLHFSAFHLFSDESEGDSEGDEAVRSQVPTGSQARKRIESILGMGKMLSVLSVLNYIGIFIPASSLCVLAR